MGIISGYLKHDGETYYSADHSVCMSLPDFDSANSVKKDDISEKLDELSDLCEYWKKHREQGRTPKAIRGAMLGLIEEIRDRKFIEDNLSGKWDNTHI